MSAIEATSCDVCPECGADVEHSSVEQDALFVHGGYGATTKTVLSKCTSRNCDWSLQRERSEVRPPRPAGSVRLNRGMFSIGRSV